MTLRSTVQLLQLPTAALALYWLLVACFPIFDPMLGDLAFRVMPSTLKMIVGSAFVVFLALVLTVFVPSHRSLTGFFSHLFFCVVVIPLCAIYGISDGPTVFLSTCVASFAISCIIFGRQRTSVGVRNPSIDRPIMAFFVVFVVAVLAYLLAQGSLKFSLLDFRSVYMLRAEAQSGEGPVAERWIMVSAYIGSSFLIAYGLLYRSASIAILGMVNSYLLYNTFGFKLFLFVIPIALCAYVYIRKSSPVALPAALCAVMTIVFFMTESSNSVVHAVVDGVNQTVIRRFIYAQPYLAFAWYDVFLDKPMIALSNLFFVKDILSYPFDDPYVVLVGIEMFGRNFVPNTGIFGTGYANFGLLGILAFTLATYALLKYIDETSVMARSALLVCGAAMPAILFFEADLIASIISFGLGLVIVICWIVRRYVSRKGALSAPLAADTSRRAT